MDGLQLIPSKSTEDLQHIVDARHSLQKTAPSEASSTPSSPTHSNPMTPERHHSMEFDPFIFNAINHYAQTPEAQAAQEEFPNPYDKPLTLPFSGHARVSSAPDLTRLRENTHSVQRLPSVLRPAHPKTFDSMGSRRATQAFSSGSEFGASPLAFGDWRSSMYCLSTFSAEDSEASALTQRPYVPRSQSSTPWLSQPSSPTIEHEVLDTYPMTDGDVENNEAPRAQSDHSDAAEAVESQTKHENPGEITTDNHITRQPTDLLPAKAIGMGHVRQKPKWKFWSKG
ncbi:hypothetical protein BU17DRAFT_78546 [Hysterangium stoloniferum]|nr:hypothetical protein BU17DRAFT_78546 [Hysterangium stoloniferum]